MKPFLFKHFSIQQENAAMKVGTDSMILGSLCNFSGKQNILDIGAGTGVLSLMLAQRFSPEILTSVELDASACIDLKENLTNSPFSPKHVVIQGNIADQSFDQKFDGIISNPPFFEDSTKNLISEKTTARHTNELSFEDLFMFVAENLSDNGQFWIIVPFSVHQKLQRLSEEHNLKINHHFRIDGKPGKPVRSVMSFSFETKSLDESVFTIRNNDGTYTDAYIDLTRDFHNTDLRKK